MRQLLERQRRRLPRRDRNCSSRLGRPFTVTPSTGGAQQVLEQPLGLVLVGSFARRGEQLHRLHRPAAALAQLEGVEVDEARPRRIPRPQLPGPCPAASGPAKRCPGGLRACGSAPFVQGARGEEKAGAGAAAERSYRDLLTAAPGYGPALLQLATVLHQQQRHAEALALLDSLLDGDGLPQGAALVVSDRLRARAHSNRGALLQLQDDLDAAQQAFGEALRLDPSLKLAGDNLLALAQVLRAQGRSHQALEALRLILRATPQRPDLLQQLGISPVELGQERSTIQGGIRSSGSASIWGF